MLIYNTYNQEKENVIMDQSFNPTPASSPEPFYQVWLKAITKPNEQTFANIAASPQAKQTTAYLWVFIAFLVSGFFSSLVSASALRPLLEQYGIDPSMVGGGFGSTLVRAICGAPVGAVISTGFFALGIYILQWIAGRFGGKGTPDQLAYTIAAAVTPIMLVNGVLSLLGAIPYVGFCFNLIALGIFIYMIVLEIMAIKAVNQITWGAAAGTFFIPFFAVLCICACVTIGLTALLGAAVGDVFSTINQSLGY
jgi:hypothetical protein